MQVNFFATFRTIIGKKTVYFDLAENTTAAQLLQVMIDTFPALSKHLLAEDGHLSPHVHFYINGGTGWYCGHYCEGPGKGTEEGTGIP